MPYAESRSARIHYSKHGDEGPAAVLIHGLGLSSRFWFDTPARLAARPERPYQVITLDSRGTGKSDKPRGAYAMRDLADDVAAVLDHAGVDRALVTGISLGGMIAQHLALRHPDRVRGLALLATTPGLPHGRLPQPRALATLLSIPFVDHRRSQRALFRLVLSEKDLHRGRELLAGYGPAMKEDPIVARGFFGQLLAAATHSTGSRLGQIRCPVVVVTGDDDVLVPLHNSRVLAKRIPGARLRVLEGTGHGIPISQPGIVEHVLDELVGLSAGA
jgi:pimeloyl-ACP methyl ester carboxylesterase